MQKTRAGSGEERFPYGSVDAEVMNLMRSGDSAVTGVV